MSRRKNRFHSNNGMVANSSDGDVVSFDPMMGEIVANLLQQRTEFFKSALDSQRRNLDADCQYPADISNDQYQEMYERNPFGRRVCRLWPSETWKLFPEVYQVEDQTETEFEAAWKKLEVELAIYPHLKMVDELSRVQHYGCMFLGTDDALPLDSSIRSIDAGDQFIPSAPKTNITFLLPLMEEQAVIKLYETNPRNPRYGLPLVYEVTFDHTAVEEQQGKQVAVDSKMDVHWSRMVHFAANRTTSKVWGTPEQKPVFNSLLDIRKILGGSAEMFWKGGFPGYSFESHPDAVNNSSFDLKTVKAQIKAYEAGLQRYFAMLGMTVKNLTVQIADPTNHLEAQVLAITTAMEVPKRQFLGSEVGQLATDEDKKTWNFRLRSYINTYTNPFVLRPFVTRVMKMGALPFVPEFKTFWPDLNAPSGKEVAEVAGLITDALYKYVVGGVHQLMPPMEYLSFVLKMDISEINAIMKSAKDSAEGDDDKDPLETREQEQQEREDEQQQAEFDQQQQLARSRQQGRQPSQSRQPTQPRQ